MGLRPLPPALAEKARLELNEDASRIDSDLQHLKDWIAKQPHLKASTDDQWLLSFLRGSKFSLERAKEKIDSYYSMRSLAPEHFIPKFGEPRFWEILDTGAIVVLPKTATPASPRIIMIRAGAYDPEKHHICEILSIFKCIMQIMFLEDDNCTVAGIETIIDCKDTTMAHLLQVTPSQMKKMVFSGQEASPTRQKGSHYLNIGPGFETTLKIVKSLLNEKNRSRLFVHNKNYEAMYNVIPKEILPAEYGGTCGTIKDITDSWKKKLQDYSSWMEEDLVYGTVTV